MAKSRPSPAPAGMNARGTASPGPRSGRGAGSALEEMLRRQAQDPRPGTSAQPAGSAQEKSAPAAREADPRQPERRQD
jgi:hypothetical protein